MRLDTLSIPVNEETYGIVHGDVYQFNMVLDEHLQVTMYDWELSCKYWYVADVGALLLQVWLQVCADKCVKGSD